MVKPKVLLLLHDLSLTGSSKVALDVFEHLGDRVSLRIIAPETGPLAERCRQIGPLQLLRVSTPPRPLPRPSRRLIAPLINLSFRSWKPDLIYANSLAVMHLAERLRLPPAPALWHIHELKTSFDMEVPDFERLSHWPRRYIAVSGPVRDLLTQTYGIDPAQVSVIHEMVRDEDFRATHPRPAATGGDAAPFVVGGAGQPLWRKGTTLWLQTAVELRRLMPDRTLRFVWVGLRENLDSCTFREEARKHKVHDIVEFVPATLQPYPHYARFDVFAMTSWEDPCPLVVLENMMLGKPVVCFAGGGGAPEEVGEAGVVVEEFDPVAMAHEIASLASDSERRRRLGEAARSRVGEHFIASRQVPKVWHEIEMLTAGGGGLAMPFPGLQGSVAGRS